MRTQQQSIALHQMLRILGGSLKPSDHKERFHQVYGAGRVANWLASSYDAEFDDERECIFTAALHLWTDEDLQNFRLENNLPKPEHKCVWEWAEDWDELGDPYFICSCGKTMPYDPTKLADMEGN